MRALPLAAGGIPPARPARTPRTTERRDDVRWENDPDRDSFLIGEALGEAREAARSDEVPVGAVVWAGGRIIGRGFNRPIHANDPTAHAEVLAIREAAARLGNYRLQGATLAVTMEPCLMCFGAAIHARIARVVFGAEDPRLGAASLVSRLQSEPGALNHRLRITGGVRAEECASILRAFFGARR